MVARTRNRKTYLPQGGHAKRVSLGVTTIDHYQYPTKPAVDNTCVDVIDGTRDPHALQIFKSKEKWDALSGVLGTPPTTYREYTNYIPDYYANTVFGHLSLPNPPSAGVLIADLIARTNPGRTDVNVPLALFELKDLIPGIRDAGSRILQGTGLRRSGSNRPSPLSEGASSIADEYLAYSFSFAPLIGDLKKLLMFSDLVDKRVEELIRLQQGQGLRRRREFPTASAASSGTRTVESRLSALVQANYTVRTIRKQWGTVRYKPSSLLRRILRRTDLKVYARRLVSNTGNGLSKSDLWNAIPFTWLIDYFLEIDTFLRATDYRIPAHAFNACVMTYYETVHSYSRANDGLPFTGGGGYCVVQTKYRTLGAPTVNLSLPALNNRQLSILGAMSLSRNRARLSQ